MLDDDYIQTLEMANIGHVRYMCLGLLLTKFKYEN